MGVEEREGGKRLKEKVKGLRNIGEKGGMAEGGIGEEEKWDCERGIGGGD